jgi:plastocyanin domain-containing protein
MRSAAIAVGVVLVLGGCSKKGDSDVPKPKPEATAKTGTVDSSGVRTVPIEANDKGYTPDRIPGKPGEKLKLVFTRTVDAECLAELVTPDGKRVPLPKGAPVEVAVTVPTTGEVKFACGMDMFSGVVVAEKAG